MPTRTPSETRPATRVRPQTTSNPQRAGRLRSAASAVVATRRTARSARARLQRPASPPPDLNPPVYTPLICEMNAGGTPDRRPDSGYETLDGHSGARSSTGSDDDADDERDKKSTLPVPLSHRSRYAERDLNTTTPADDSDAIKDTENMDPQRSQEENEKILKRRPRTTAQLKEFLAAAMDSVRFFLVTSSIGQANKKNNKQDDDLSDTESESSDDETPPVKQLTRSELLIMNGALMEPPWRFTMETYREDKELLQYYTGFASYDLIHSVFTMVKPSYDTIPNWVARESPENVREGAFKSGIITLLDEFFMFLYKLRHNPSNEDLSIRFSMPVEAVQGILNDWLHYLYTCFCQSPIWPSRDNADIFMPRCYKSVCPCARGIIHVAKVKVKCPQEYFDSLGVPESDSDADELKDLVEDFSNPEEATVDNSQSTRPGSRSSTPSRRPSIARRSSIAGTQKLPKLKKSAKKTSKPDESAQQTESQTKTKKHKTVRLVHTDGVQPDKNDFKHYKCIVVYQPTGAACLVSKLYPESTPSEQIIKDSGFLPLLDECDDVVTLNKEDDLQHEVMEDMLHPYAANYMSLNFLTGCMTPEEFRRRAPMKAHHVRCMRWHVFHSVGWIRDMKVWDDLAELPLSWVNNVDRVWKICCLLTNFLPSLPCLDIEATHTDVP